MNPILSPAVIKGALAAILASCAVAAGGTLISNTRDIAVLKSKQDATEKAVGDIGPKIDKLSPKIDVLNQRLDDDEKSRDGHH